MNPKTKCSCGNRKEYNAYTCLSCYNRMRRDEKASNFAEARRFVAVNGRVTRRDLALRLGVSVSYVEEIGYKMVRDKEWWAVDDWYEPVGKMAAL